MPASKKDLYTNFAFGSVTASAANVLTFAQIISGVSIHEKVAWIIHRVEYYFSALTIADMDNTADLLQVALTGSDSLASLEVDEARIYDKLDYLTRHDGTAASAQYIEQPFIHDYSQMPGGGLLIPPHPLFCAIVSTGFTIAVVAVARIYFTYKSLTSEEFWELVQTRQVVQ